jgi:outer membrane protein assembly factor BamB
MTCLDFFTGKLIWEIPINGIIQYFDGKIVVSYGNVSCYSVQNGNLLWTINTDLTYGNSKMDVYNGNLYILAIHCPEYYSPVYLHNLSMATGTVNWFDAGPDKGIYGDITIDQETGYLYCNSRRSVMCIDLNKTPKK